MRYVVPYTAPGIRHGELRVDAESSEAAMIKARMIHESNHYRVSKRYPDVGGPGAGAMPYRTASGHTDGSAYRSYRTLSVRQRAVITYGEPRPIEAVAA